MEKVAALIDRHITSGALAGAESSESQASENTEVKLVDQATKTAISKYAAFLNP